MAVESRVEIPSIELDHINGVPIVDISRIGDNNIELAMALLSGWNEESASSTQLHINKSIATHIEDVMQMSEIKGIGFVVNSNRVDVVYAVDNRERISRHTKGFVSQSLQDLKEKGFLHSKPDYVSHPSVFIEVAGKVAHKFNTKGGQLIGMVQITD